MKRWIHASSSTANIPNTKDGWIDYFQNNYFREYPDYDGLDDLADYLDGKEADTDWSYALEDYGADPEVVAALEKFVAKNQSAAFPDKIRIAMHPDSALFPTKEYVYDKMYVHEGGGCYYRSKDNPDPVTNAFVSLYPDGHLTYLWNGTEMDLDAKVTNKY